MDEAGAKRKKLPIGRIVMGVFALLFIWFSVGSFISAAKYKARVDQWVTAHPIELDVDLSQPGKYTGEFIQTCEACHSEELYLELPDEIDKDIQVDTLIQGLSFKCSIADSQGNIVMTEKSAGRPVDIPYNGNNIPLLYFSPFKSGTYTLEFEVISSAENLKGIPQKLVAKYQLCGIELLPAGLMIVCGLILLGLSIILVLVIIIITIFKRRKLKAIRQANKDST